MEVLNTVYVCAVGHIESNSMIIVCGTEYFKVLFAMLTDIGLHFYYLLHLSIPTLQFMYFGYLLLVNQCHCLLCFPFLLPSRHSSLLLFIKNLLKLLQPITTDL